MSTTLTVFPRIAHVPTVDQVVASMQHALVAFLARLGISRSPQVNVARWLEDGSREAINPALPVDAQFSQTPMVFELDKRGPVADIRYVEVDSLDWEIHEMNREAGWLGGLAPDLAASLSLGHHWYVSVGGLSVERELMLAVGAFGLARLVDAVIYSDEKLPEFFGSVPVTSEELRQRLFSPNNPVHDPALAEYAPWLVGEFGSQ